MNYSRNARSPSMERLAHRFSSTLSVNECSAHEGQQNYLYDPTSPDWRFCTNGTEEFWRSQNINMPRLTPLHATESSLAVESMQNDVDRYVSRRMKSEPSEQRLPSVVGRGPVWQSTGKGNLERIAPLEPTNFQLIVEDLPQLPYETARQQNLGPTPRVIYFRTRRPSGSASAGVCGSEDIGFPLLKAIENELDTLIDSQKPASLGDASAKISIRLLFHGCEPYNRQIMARRSTANSEPISMGTLAHKIAQEMQRCLANTHIAGKPLTHRGRLVQLEDLYLWRLVQVSPGSWIPEFKVNMMMWDSA